MSRTPASIPRECSPRQGDQPGGIILTAGHTDTLIGRVQETGRASRGSPGKAGISMIEENPGFAPQPGGSMRPAANNDLTPTWAMPDPIEITCAQCGQAVVCDSSSEAARDKTCGECSNP